MQALTWHASGNDAPSLSPLSPPQIRENRGREARVLLLGLDAAGKTAMLYRYKLGDLLPTLPTTAYNTEIVECDEVTLRVWDVGGQDPLRPTWRYYAQQREHDAVIFAVDSLDRQRFPAAKAELQKLLQMDELKEALFVVAATKQDLPSAAPPEEVAEELSVQQHADRVHVQGCSAASGHGLDELMSWVAARCRTRERGFDDGPDDPPAIRGRSPARSRVPLATSPPRPLPVATPEHMQHHLQLLMVAAEKAGVVKVLRSVRRERKPEDDSAEEAVRRIDAVLAERLPPEATEVATQTTPVATTLVSAASQSESTAESASLFVSADDLPDAAPAPARFDTASAVRHLLSTTSLRRASELLADASASQAPVYLRVPTSMLKEFAVERVSPVERSSPTAASGAKATPLDEALADGEDSSLSSRQPGSTGPPREPIFSPSGVSAAVVQRAVPGDADEAGSASVGRTRAHSSVSARVQSHLGSPAARLESGLSATVQSPVALHPEAPLVASFTELVLQNPALGESIAQNGQQWLYEMAFDHSPDKFLQKLHAQGFRCSPATSAAAPTEDSGAAAMATPDSAAARAARSVPAAAAVEEIGAAAAAPPPANARGRTGSAASERARTGSTAEAVPDPEPGPVPLDEPGPAAASSPVVVSSAPPTRSRGSSPTAPSGTGRRSPRDGAFSKPPPKRRHGSSTPPRRGSSTPPRRGSGGTPRRGSGGTPPRQGSGTPSHRGSSTPPRGGSTTPPRRGSSTPPRRSTPVRRSAPRQAWMSFDELVAQDAALTASLAMHPGVAKLYREKWQVRPRATLNWLQGQNYCVGLSGKVPAGGS
eukprot:TRINITY_DN21057_c0_g1_i1.p1 TRINITY_DN21057_c0_g1~~TRINITY_DN21057_c0_g1_i1.p1  ORF type:complete len:827 (+),score=249.94 TRINITY_DN21057_c0_g1_i1:745-3225(+)